VAVYAAAFGGTRVIAGPDIGLVGQHRDGQPATVLFGQRDIDREGGA
jgi:hypothetical protein